MVESVIHVSNRSYTWQQDIEKDDAAIRKGEMNMKGMEGGAEGVIIWVV